MSRRRALTIAAAGAAALPALLALATSGSCSLADLYSGATGGTGGMSSTSSTASSGGSDAGGPDASDADASDADAADAPSCPPDMVEVPFGTASFCVDRREVTNAQYAAFLAAVDASAPKEPPGACDWNTSYAPAVAVDAGADLPVLGVDWCDAYAYCAWAGKRLCGAVGGGALAPEARDLTGDQWWNACSRKGTRHYPYGDTFDITACADCDPDAGCDVDASPPTSQPVPVGSKPACAGGFGGIFDMSGNAWEWQDACGDAGFLPDAAGEGGAPIPDPRYDTCYRRGGSYYLPKGSSTGQACMGCSSLLCKAAGDLRKNKPKDVGLRCCLDL
jgi:formylglycine-generating enzyme required for sulfatase activity